MDLARRFLPALIAAAALSGASGALAAEPEAIATAPATSAATLAATGAPPVSVADQIDTYLKTSPAAALPKDGASGVTSGAEEPRKVHGMVDVAVGTNGYRSAYVRSDVPVGKTGTLSIAVGESKFDGRAYGGYGGGYGGRFGGVDRQSLALGLSLGGSTLDPHDPRCRMAREDAADGRYDPRLEGGRLSTCQAAGARTSQTPQ
jgi:hypothetical protein